MKVLLIGANGKMGKKMQEVMAQKHIEFCGIDKDNRKDAHICKCDVIVDFSTAESLESNLSLAKEKNLPIVIATTNHSAKNLDLINEASKEMTIFMSSNFSILFNVLLNCINGFAKLKECDFVVEETHHKLKKDSPSGSCKEIIKKLDELNLSYTLHCNRVGDVVGEHKIKIYGQNEMLEISHNAMSREVFCNGALAACQFILNRPHGLYHMKDLL